MQQCITFDLFFDLSFSCDHTLLCKLSFAHLASLFSRIKENEWSQCTPTDVLLSPNAYRLFLVQVFPLIGRGELESTQRWVPVDLSAIASITKRNESSSPKKLRKKNSFKVPSNTSFSSSFLSPSSSPSSSRRSQSPSSSRRSQSPSLSRFASMKGEMESCEVTPWEKFSVCVFEESVST